MYNGYKNYETWLTCLWFTNEERTYRYWKALTEKARETHGDDYYATRAELAAQMKDKIEDHLTSENENEQAGLKRDLLRAAIANIDFHEIAEYFMEE